MRRPQMTSLRLWCALLAVGVAGCVSSNAMTPSEPLTTFAGDFLRQALAALLF